MKTLVTVAIMVGLLVLVGLATAAITSVDATDNTYTGSCESGSCPNAAQGGCTAGNNCGSSNCGATTGSSCGGGCGGR
ncbi:hypothetical protein ISS08_00325 [Candidatus Pacearchaeota archaeon]|nr:hypothetical protein [Candidatus Pacearchaeota archaeon]